MISIKILELIAKAENVVMYLFIKKNKKNKRKYKLYCKQYRSFQLNKNDSWEK